MCIMDGLLGHVRDEEDQGQFDLVMIGIGRRHGASNSHHGALITFPFSEELVTTDDAGYVS